jgi:serine/threonine-protein kinase HipA
MGNTDNHPRNSALRKTRDGAIRLSPLYDFAPMFLDDQGIPRACRWSGAEEGGMPEWGRVAEVLADAGMDAKFLRARLGDFAETIRRLPEIMGECGVDGWLIQRLVRRIDAVARSLDAARPAEARSR